jgi:2-succinyl-6-hydroxy-2,4-cyclohexadiene-1-carboxylate synthase/o-succinylbenzoate synthase
MTTSGPPTTLVLELAGGVTSNVRLHGPDGSPRPAVVLLHGFTGDASTMDGLAVPLADGDDDDGVDGGGPRRVIAVNLTGHGGSRGPDEASYSVEALVSQLIEVFDALDERRPVDVVGYSMGGRVALALACRHPGRVRTLSLIGASAGLADPGERAARAADDDALATSIESDGLESFVDRWMANPLFATQARLGEARLAEFRTQRLRNEGSELARSLRAAGTGTMRPLHDDVAACPVPTMLLVGAEDPKFAAIAEELCERMPNCRVAVIPVAGHAAHLENPEAVLVHLRRGLTTDRDNEARLGDATVVGSRHVIRAALRSPLVTAHGTATSRTSVLYAIEAAGHTGWGEASPLPGWSRESIEECLAVLPDRAPVDVAAFDDVPAARAAVVGAMLDLDARRGGRLLRDHLAELHGTVSAVADTIEVNGVVSATSPETVAAEVAALVARGLDTIKLKVAVGSIGDDVARVAAARAAGSGIVLRLDANGGWDHDSAIDALALLADFEIALCEEPVPGLDAIAAVGAASPVAVAVDESVRTVVDLQRLWTMTKESKSIAAVVIKPQAIGGPDVAMQAIAEARRHGLDVIVTTMIDSAVGVAHAVHVAAAAGLPGAHGLDTSRLLAVDVAPIADAFPIVAGRLSFASTRGPDERRRFGDGLAIGPVSPRLVSSP